MTLAAEKDFDAILAQGGCLPPMVVAERPRRSQGSPQKSQPTKRAGSRFPLLNAMVDQHIAKLKPSEFMVWMIIWRHVNQDTQLATIAHNTIADKAGLKRRAAIKAAKDLEAKGYLTVVTRGGPNGASNTYRPTIPS